LALDHEGEVKILSSSALGWFFQQRRLDLGPKGFLKIA